jgi:hypothetical protein
MDWEINRNVYLRIESSLFAAAEEVARVDEVKIRDEVVRETGDLFDDCC